MTQFDIGARFRQRDVRTDDGALLSAEISPGRLWSAKRDPSLRNLLHELIFMMQSAEYGSLHNPVPDRQTVSVLVGGNLLRHGLRQTGA
jgi:hypothetical protein